MPSIRYLLLFLLFGASSCLNLIKPAHRFSVAGAGPAPSYADSIAWGALPGHRSAARQRPPGLQKPAFSPVDTVADVFYVHPTTYFWKLGYWNAPLGKRRLRRFTDRAAFRNQASLFQDAGRLYAPRYRQATLYAFFTQDSASRRQALNLAYADVRAAFQYYLAHYNHGRPFIVAGHSQGTTHALRLLHELVDDNPRLRRQLVAAYLVGRRVRPDEYRHLPPLRDSLATGGIVAWNTARRGTEFPPYRSLLVTNPLTWTLDTAAVPAARNPGSVPLTFRRVVPHLTGAQIHQGILWADVGPSRAGFPRLHVPGESELTASYHLVDLNLFYLSIRQNARARVRAWLAKNKL